MITSLKIEWLWSFDTIRGYTLVSCTVYEGTMATTSCIEPDMRAQVATEGSSIGGGTANSRQGSTETASSPRSRSSSLVPTLAIHTMDGNGNLTVPFEPNARTPVPIESSFFSGSALILVRLPPDVDPYARIPACCPVMLLPNAGDGSLPGTTSHVSLLASSGDWRCRSKAGSLKSQRARSFWVRSSLSACSWV